MNEQKVYLNDADEYFETFTHESGLKVFISKKNFHTSYALLCVNFGSLCEKSVVNGEQIELPDGIAHFLEHKMFENEDGEDTFLKFSKFGANANAYTGTDRTCYLFSASGNLYESLEVLLDSVFSPYFTDANVKKEKGIIIEELKMYRDDPNEGISRALMENMYSESRLKKDICGSVKSVGSITKEDLYKAYGLFYTPDNMILSLCGNFDKDKVAEILGRTVKNAKAQAIPKRIKELCEEQSTNVKKRRATIYREIPTPVFSLGIKCDRASNSPEQHLKTFNAMCVLAYALFAPNAPFAGGLKKDNLIPGDPSFDITHSFLCSHIIFSTETYDAKELSSRFEKERKKILEEGIPEKSAEQTKKVLYAEYLDSFNSSESIAHLHVGNALDGLDTEATTRSILDLSNDEINRIAKDLLDQNRICLQIALPKEQKQRKEQK